MQCSSIAPPPPGHVLLYLHLYIKVNSLSQCQCSVRRGSTAAQIAGSKPAREVGGRGGRHGLLFHVICCVVRLRSLRRADDSSGGVLPNVLCLSVNVEPLKGRPRLGIGSKHQRKRKIRNRTW